MNGQLVMTSQQRNYFELVNGTHGRSGEQFDIWSASFGPIGKDGYFEPLFDKLVDASKSNRAKAQDFIKDLKPIGAAWRAPCPPAASAERPTETWWSLRPLIKPVPPPLSSKPS